MERYLFVIIAGICGAFLAQRIHMPGGAVVGSMIFSGMAALLIPEGVTLSPRMGTTVQIILGISLGMTFNRSFLDLGIGIIPLAIVSALILMLVAICMALLAAKLGLLDFGTALFGFSPGGMTGMAILSDSEGHNAPVVAFLHLVRIFTLFIAVPLLVRLFFHFKG